MTVCAAVAIGGGCAPQNLTDPNMYGSLDMNMDDYCAKWLRVSKVRVNHTGNYGNYNGTFVCEKEVELSKDSAPLLPQRSMLEFLTFLEENDFRILYVGDSLAGQMMKVFSSALPKKSLASFRLRVFSTGQVPFLGPLPNMRLNDSHLDDENIPIWSDHWVKTAIRIRATHVVLNTGAWFALRRLHLTRDHPNYRGPDQEATGDELIAAYAAHFSPNSVLYEYLSFLKNRSIALIWRDMAPGGVCKSDGGSRCSILIHTYFPIFNAIARKAIRGLGGLVISDVWRSGLGAWQDHMSLTKDPLHWCLSVEVPVPLYWNSKLFELLEEQVYVNSTVKSGGAKRKSAKHI